ncbi:MAG: hypothetical protein RLZZ450_4291 [Pseudomonadota bacterium]
MNWKKLRFGTFPAVLAAATLLTALTQAQDKPVVRSPSRWGGWLSIGAGPARGDAISAAGIRRTTWALEAGLNISYSVLYLGGGASFLNFEDTRPLRVTVMPEFGGGPTMKRTAKAEVGGGFAEAGLTYRFFVALGQPGRRREQQGFALQPALGYGFQGMATVRRTIASCADCTRDEVADYHAGQYLRFQFGVQYASCVPLASVCGYLGVNPSYKRYFDGPTPQLERYIEIAVTLGFAYPNVRTR